MESKLKESNITATWPCSVCSETRPNDKISVVQHDRSEDFSLEPGTFFKNAKYCNDNPECVKVANNYEEWNYLQRIRAQVVLDHLESTDKTNKIMKYIGSFIAYLLLLCLVNGSLDFALTDRSFWEGFFPIEHWYKWIVRVGFAVTFAVFQPISLRN